MNSVNQTEGGGKTMRTEISRQKRLAKAISAEMKQDFLIVSSFALWAMLLGFSPVLAVRFLAGG